MCCWQLLIDAVKWVCANGHKLLPLYTFDLDTGEWKHADDDFQKHRRWISDLDFFGRSRVFILFFIFGTANGRRGCQRPSKGTGLKKEVMDAGVSQRPRAPRSVAVGVLQDVRKPKRRALVPTDGARKEGYRHAEAKSTASTDRPETSFFRIRLGACRGQLNGHSSDGWPTAALPALGVHRSGMLRRVPTKSIKKGSRARAIADLEASLGLAKSPSPPPTSSSSLLSAADEIVANLRTPKPITPVLHPAVDMCLRHVCGHAYGHAWGTCHASLETSRRGGHYEYRPHPIPFR